MFLEVSSKKIPTISLFEIVLFMMMLLLEDKKKTPNLLLLNILLDRVF